ncbi:hypothetical protein SH2C18_25010 [Clostridium sediminicola]|uniref:PspC domain-containing protein n=1 Tax=Clostridium sediminicola TaxID=3114879 RepID=UPI0031F1EA59
MNNSRLYKSTTDKKISGVCGGLAEALGLDPSIVRIVWALVSLFYGFGIILYIIAALVLPEGKPQENIRRNQQSNSNGFSKRKEESSETEAYDVNYKEVKSFDDVEQ